MHQARYLVKLVSTFVSRFKGIIILGVVFGFLVFVFIRFVAPLVLPSHIERVGLTGRFTPDNLPESVVNLVSSGLTKVDEKGEVEPALASSWEAGDDGKTWVFHLNQATWQDDKPVIANDLIYQFEDVETEKPNDQTIVFKLASPFSPMPSVVAKPAFKKGLLGTGEWKVTKISLRGGYVEKLVLQNQARERKIFKFYPTEERAKLAFKLGEINRLEEIVSPSPFDSWNTVKVIPKENIDQFAAVFLNNQDNLLSDKKLRQALFYGTDKDSFGYRRAISPICPVCWAFNPQVKPYTFDQQKAKDLITNSPEIKLTTTPILLDVAEKIAQDWREIGVTTSVQVASTIPPDYQAFLAIYDIPNDPDQYATWHSSQTATNISHYANPRIDKLLEEGRLELDKEKRREIYLDFQRFLLEDAPAIFLYHPITYTITRK